MRRFLMMSPYLIPPHTDVQMIKGFKNVFAGGGEGLFMTTLKGPGGVVWLQGQPPQRMISEIARRVPGGGLLA
jgi:uncharacterized protein (AIM24 family)